jgi:hypothetical protein
VLYVSPMVGKNSGTVRDLVAMSGKQTSFRHRKSEAIDPIGDKRGRTMLQCDTRAEMGCSLHGVSIEIIVPAFPKRLPSLQRLRCALVRECSYDKASSIIVLRSTHVSLSAWPRRPLLTFWSEGSRLRFGIRRSNARRKFFSLKRIKANYR